MASTILSDNGASSGSAGLKTTADSTGALALQTSTSGGAATTAVTIDTSQNVALTGGGQLRSNATNTPVTFADSAGTQVGTLCRAWVNYKGTSTRAIRASFNVSSVTYNTFGDYTVNFTNAMTDANYAALATTNQNAAGNSNSFSIGYPDNSSTVLYSTTQVRFTVHYGATASFDTDTSTVSVAIFR